MEARRTITFAEAAEAASVAERQLAGLERPLQALGKRLRELDPALVFTCARGSSDHAATFAKYLIETRGLAPVASYPPSLSSLYAAPGRKLGGTLFLAISQSGHSPDIVASASGARENGALVVALVNDEHSPLARIAELVIPLLAGPERSVAATKSFIASCLAVVHLVAAWSQDAELAKALDDTPRMLRQAWELDWSRAVPALANVDNLFVLGRGLNLGIAEEAALKLKETCGIHAEAFSAAEVRHGPATLVGPAFPAFMLVPEDACRDGYAELAADFLSQGAKVVMAGGEQEGAIALPGLHDLHPALAPLATIQSFYRLAVELSVARGRDPDRPPHLSKVTDTR